MVQLLSTKCTMCHVLRNTMLMVITCIVQVQILACVAQRSTACPQSESRKIRLHVQRLVSVHVHVPGH